MTDDSVANNFAQTIIESNNATLTNIQELTILYRQNQPGSCMAPDS